MPIYNKTMVFQRWLLENWFIPSSILLACSLIIVTKTSNWSSPAIIEKTVLFSFSILLPILYLCCYRSGLRRSLIRMAGLSFLGVLAASFLVPDEYQQLLLQLKPLRYIGMAVLFIIEIKLLFMMIQFITSAELTEEELSEQLAAKGDLPEWYTKLMAFEAVFWRRVFNFIKKPFK